MTYAPMSTLGHVISEGLEKTHFTKLHFRKYRPRFGLVSVLLEMSAAKQVHSNNHMLKSSALRLEQVGEAVVLMKKRFRSCNSPVDMHSITLNRYWFSLMQRHHILMQELENGVARGPEVPPIIWYRYCMPQPR